MSKIAVLVSGGMDSSILMVDLADKGHEVYPIYIAQGLFWEKIELDYLARFLQAVARDNIQPVKMLFLPSTDIYDTHWSVSGDDVPDETTEDEAVYLPGRNLLLLTKAGIWCSLNNIKTIALAPLKGNPFSDNTDLFYDSMSRVIDIAVDWRLEIIRPYCNMDKEEVIEIGKNLPLELTFSCIQPAGELHCGACNKCAERKLAYEKLGLNDNTGYAEYSEI
jgi:7-cyano-7-deazaguanine synthase